MLKNIGEDYKDAFFDGTSFNLRLKKYQILIMSLKSQTLKAKPIFYILTNSFSQENYSKILTFINKLVNLKKINVHVDFEYSLL